MSTLKLPTLLVVTENPSVRVWVKKHLDQEFFIIDVSRKKAAIETAQTAALDFVIIDSELESCDALELSLAMKQILRTLTPILLITGRLKKSYIDAALDAGVTDFLNSQLDPEELHMRVATIRKSQELREKTQGISASLPRANEDVSGSYLKDRVRLHNQALKMFKEAKTKGILITALILGIDHFDALRNQVGSLATEEIFSLCMDQIKRYLSKEDLLIPASEGRFIALLQNTSPEIARPLVEKLQKEAFKSPIETKQGSFSLTLSIAVSPLKEINDFNLIMDGSLKALKKVKDLIIPFEKKEKL